MTKVSVHTLAAGKYRAITPVAVALCHRSEQREFSEYAAGETFDVPATVNGFRYGVIQTAWDAIKPQWEQV